MFSGLKNYLLLIRFYNQVGTILLFIPCLLGLKLANALTFFNIFLFLTCSFFARSCGCILNDIADRKIDANTPTTSHRVLASGMLTIKKAFLFMCILIVTSLPLLAFFSKHIFIPLIISGIFVVIYPYSKRFFPVPQVFLGITYASGFIIAVCHGLEKSVFFLNCNVFIIYLALILWVIFYDTIYAKRDFQFDKLNKTHSSAVFFSKIPISYNEKTRINLILIVISILFNIILFCTVQNISAIRAFALAANLTLQISSIFATPANGFKLNAACIMPMMYLV